MHHLIIGAGATLAEAQNLGCSPSICPPLIKDFARKMWANYSPHPILENYLHNLGYSELGRDPRDLFYLLEDKNIVSVERFLEFAWENRAETWRLKRTAFHLDIFLACE